MSNYEEPAGRSTLEWPYPVHYGKENEVSADVLVLDELGAKEGKKDKFVRISNVLNIFILRCSYLRHLFHI